jgi:RNA polymerase sigma-70 factor, ECF subfamily
MESDTLSIHAQQALANQAQAGDKSAYDRLFAQAAARLQLFIRVRLGKRLREKLDSLDVLQDTYVEADKAFAKFVCNDEDAFARWLCCIAENRIRGLADHFNAKKRRAPGELLPVSKVLEEARKSQHSPATAAARLETREALARALEQLDDELREILLLRHFQGRTIDEIAQVTGQSQSGVRRLIGRAQHSLGRVMREGGHHGSK